MPSIDVGAVVQAVLSVTGGPALHHPPKVTKEDVLAVMDQLSDLGNYQQVNEFERLLATVCGRRHAIVTSSGTAALEIALAVAGIRAGDKVAIPALGFVAGANSIKHLGGVLEIVDVRETDMGMNPLYLSEELTDVDDVHGPVKAVIAVHNVGHPCHIRGIEEVANLHGVPVIEDAAEALGSLVYDHGKMRPCGSFGLLSVMSFNLNKIVTTGGGGAVLCDDDGLANLARRLATTARVQHPWLVEHDAVAWNHRMPMLPAALGMAQLRRIDRLVAAKRALAKAYEKALGGIDGVMFHEEPRGTRSNYWLPTMWVPPEERDSVLTALHGVGVMARAMFTPINQLAPYRKHGFWVADQVFRQAVCLPAGIELAERFL